MGLARSLAGLATAHLVGTALLSAASIARGTAPRVAIASHALSATSALFTAALVYAASLGASGLPIAAALLAALAFDEHREPVFTAFPRAWTAGFVALAAVVLWRPMTPTCWDEFVWLGKARLESEGFGTGVRLSLDPHAHLTPQGYPTLWPAAAGWFAIGADDLETLTAGASLVVVLACGAFVEALVHSASTSRTRVFLLSIGIAVGAPLVLVHLRSTYVDLPLGLLGASLFLTLAREAPSTASVATFAVVLAGMKDEGVAHLAGAVVGAAVVHGRVRGLPRAFAFAAASGAVALVTWQLALSAHAVAREHGNFQPVFSWFSSLARLGFAHGTELTSWGAFWPAVVVSVAFSWRTHGPHRLARGLAVALAINALFVVAMLVCGPPRVRAFAENGTLVNRVLVQFWPLAAALLLLSGAPDDERAATETAGESP